MQNRTESMYIRACGNRPIMILEAEVVIQVRLFYQFNDYYSVMSEL